VMPAPYLSAALQFATLAWDGNRLLFTHTLNGRFEIFRLNVERPDAPEPVTAGREVSVAPDGTVAFRAVAGDGGLWTVDRNGHEPRQLATASVNYPLITPDGKHIVYTGPTDGGQKVFSIPLAGDAPATLVYKDPIGITGFSDVSPDGKSIAFIIDRKWHVCDFPVCTTPKPIGPAQGSRPRWTPDGRGIAYIDGNSATNVWVQPIDGSAPAQLTQFTDGRTLGNFAWSRDGQRLAVSRATFTTDIVLFRGLQPQ
jgi:Tol biopolymer transport system component